MSELGKTTARANLIGFFQTGDGRWFSRIELLEPRYADELEIPTSSEFAKHFKFNNDGKINPVRLTLEIE